MAELIIISQHTLLMEGQVVTIKGSPVNGQVPYDTKALCVLQ